MGRKTKIYVATMLLVWIGNGLNIIIKNSTDSLEVTNNSNEILP